jgi:hypothetical protein
MNIKMGGEGRIVRAVDGSGPDVNENRAQVCPLYESCPPRFYGGTERVVSHLTQELVRQGHEVTLFASADSQTNANLEACCEQALRLDPNARIPSGIIW